MFTALCCKPHNYRFVHPAVTAMLSAIMCISDISASVSVNFVFLGLGTDIRILSGYMQ